MTSRNIRVKQNPHLKQVELLDGRKSLFLEYYHGRTATPRLDEQGNQMYYTTGKMIGKPMMRIKHIRERENLGLYLYGKPRNLQEREHNRETLLLAEQIRREREQEVMLRDKGYRVNTYRNANVFVLLDAYLADEALTDIKGLRFALDSFKTFIRERHRYYTIPKPAKEVEEMRERARRAQGGKHRLNENRAFDFALRPQQLSESLMLEFWRWLSENRASSGACTAFSRFKKLVRYLVKEGVLSVNPCDEIKIGRQPDNLTKDILTADEIEQLANAPYVGNPDVRRAFYFSLYTGVRFCDVKELRYRNIDYKTRRIVFEQKKTRGRSRASVVTLPLSETVEDIVGTPKQYGKTNDSLVFDLPSHTQCLNVLRRWTTRSGIDKHITWHCARHSFASNLVQNGANIAVTAQLLGHSGLGCVQKYVHAFDFAKIAAIESLPRIKI